MIADCNLGKKLCYLNENLKDLKINPEINFLPLKGKSSLIVTKTTSHWAANWQKIVGGSKNLSLEFDGADEVNFKVPYLFCDLKNQCSIDFLTLDEKQTGKISFTDFDQKSFLTILPSIQNKFSGFNGKESSFFFSFKIVTTEKTEKEKEKEQIKELLAQIDFLKKEIARLQAEIKAILAARGQSFTKFWWGACGRFERNLYFGMTNSFEVRCLQEFLKNQGPEIYPKGLITGNFLSLTQSAVIRFQEKYTQEILTPWGLKKGTGFVGKTTRAKINQLLGY